METTLASARNNDQQSTGYTIWGSTIMPLQQSIEYYLSIFPIKYNILSSLHSRYKSIYQKAAVGSVYGRSVQQHAPSHEPGLGSFPTCTTTLSFTPRS